MINKKIKGKKNGTNPQYLKVINNNPYFIHCKSYVQFSNKIATGWT